MRRTYRYAPFNQQNSDGGRLDALYVGTTTRLPPTAPVTTDYNRLRLEYDYDSFGNLKTLREGFNGGSVVTHDFTYDAYNRLLTAFGYSYAYDTAGRITSYEGSALGYDSVKKHAVNTVGGVDRYDYDLNGNVTIRNKGLSSQQTLTWNVENQLVGVAATGLSESYYYNEHGIRIRKVSNGATTLYPFAHYEVENGVIVKYYFFGGQRVAMKRGTGAITYLHQDHLGSTALSTTSSGAFDVGQGYRGYGNYRTGGSLPTEHRYTGQKLDIATGLMYYNARYYDRAIGHFISPDTLVPDPASVWDYNRFLYARGNPLKYTDPTGHCSSVAAGSPVMLADMGFCPGGSPSGKSGGGGAVVFIAGGMTTVAAGYLIGQVAHDLMQDVRGYITPDTGPAGSTVHADPLPVTSSASTSFPLADGGPETSVPASTGVYNDTLNVLADPLPGVDPTGHIVFISTEREILKSIRSYERLLAEHEQKLADFIQNPDAYDNKGFLKEAPTEQIRQNIIQGRINELNRQISRFHSEMEKLQRQLDQLRGE